MRLEVALAGRPCDHPGTVSSPSIPLVSSVAVRLPDRTRAMALALGLAAVGLYLLVGGQDSGTDEFIPLAGALLHGQLSVDARPWVELVPERGHVQARSQFFAHAPGLSHELLNRIETLT